MYRYAILVFMCLASPGLGKLPKPANVVLDSRNLKNILRWNPPPDLEGAEDVQYTVQYRLDVNESREFSVVCMTQYRECDLTYIKYKFFVRVRAAVGDDQSDWVVIPFDPYTDSLGKLPKPANVVLASRNFENILRWNPPPGFERAEDVQYTVQYRLDVTRPREFSGVCKTQYRECDLTSITYKCFVRVRAAVGDNQSDWVVIQFDPYTDTAISPPEVVVSSRSGHLDLSVSGPFLYSNSKNGPIKEKYGELYYRVLYWKEEDPSQVVTVNISQSTETLTQLQPWTSYCLKVKAFVPHDENEGEFSPAICEATTDHGRIPWWQVAGVFLVMMLTTMIVALGLCYFGLTAYKKYQSFPSYSIPEHLKEYLSKPFSGSPALPIQPSEECGESCEQLTFVSEESEETKEEPDNTA